MKETMLPLFATMAEKAQRPVAAELDDQTDPTLSTPDDYAAPAETVIATIPLGAPVRAIAVSPHRDHLYVAGRDSLAVIGSMHHVVARIPLNGDPNNMMIDRNGTRVFVTYYDGSIAVVDTEYYTIHTIVGEWNSGVVVSRDGAFIYAAHNQTAGDAFGSVISVMNSRGATVATLRCANDVTALAISPDGTRLYMTGCERGSYYQYPVGWLTIIDTATCAAITTIAVGACPGTMTVSPDGAHLYITHYDTHSVSAVDLTNNGVSAIDLRDAPLRVAVTPDCVHAYIIGEHSLTVIDTATHEATVIAVGDLPRDLRISPDGKRAYVANYGDHTVSVVDTITESVTATVAVSDHPETLAVSHNGERLYVGDYWSAAVTVISVPSVQGQYADS